ncbi:MAG: ankyrin repeat domain-containing protein [Clostridium sp.]|nr:ankyrin repeat domain-containing protein [Clostridium sp.]
MSIFKSNDIISATKNNDIELVKTLIKSSNVDYKDKNHKSAIFYAVENSNIEILDLLINNGANVYMKDDRGLTIFHYVVLSGDKILIDYFFNRKKFNVDIKNIKKDVKDININDDRILLNIIKKIF